MKNTVYYVHIQLHRQAGQLSWLERRANNANVAGSIPVLAILFSTLNFSKTTKRYSSLTSFFRIQYITVSCLYLPDFQTVSSPLILVVFDMLFYHGNKRYRKLTLLSLLLALVSVIALVFKYLFVFISTSADFHKKLLFKLLLLGFLFNQITTRTVLRAHST